ncbi:MAG: CPBP family intramembrane metalloprotease [Anaerolineae bacterium]|nr:CPBP family intramembrane metalloprotease [Anaerolineae bacterium]
MIFRGALQPRFGLILTSFLFAVIHVQYGLSPAVVQVFVLGLVLGIIRQRGNLTMSIACIRSTTPPPRGVGLGHPQQLTAHERRPAGTTRSDR